MLFFLFLTFLFQNAEIPFKPSDEFEVKINLQFKTRNISNESTGTVDFTDQTNKRKTKRTAGPQAYLKLNLRMLKLSEDEAKLEIYNTLGTRVYSKKANLSTVVALDMGYLDDIKEKAVANGLNMDLLSREKKVINRITIVIEKDGSYLLNGAVYGKF